MTDRDGAFAADGLWPGAITINARGPGCVTTHATQFDLAIGEQKTDVRVLAERGYTIAGTVVRKGTATPLANVEVNTTLDHIPRSAPITTTDATGRFVVHGLEAGKYDLELEGGDSLAAFVPTLAVDRDITDLKLEMEAGRTIRGRVEPPGVVSVSVDTNSWNIRSLESRRNMNVKAETDRRGEFTLIVPAGDIALVAYSQTTGLIGRGKLGATDEQIVIALAPQGQASLVLRIVDEQDVPVANERVFLHWTPNDVGFMQASRDLVTDADGIVRAPNIPVGTLSVDLATREAMQRRLRSGRPQDIEIVPGEQHETLVVRTQTQNAVIRGVVLHEGTPMSNVLVHAEPTVNDTAHTTLTDADGQFEFTGLRSVAHRLSATTSSGDAVTVDDVAAAPGDDVTIELESRYALELAVTDAGRRVIDFELACESAHGITYMSSSSLHANRMRKLLPGPVTCQVSIEGRVAVASGVVGRDMRLDFVLAPSGRITGRFERANGQPVAPGAVEYRNERGVTAYAETDKDGNFAIEHVAAGNGELVARDGNDQRVTTTISVASGGRTNVTLRFP